MNTTVLANGRVITCDERDTIAEAVAIRAGRILVVGQTVAGDDLASRAQD